MVALAAFILPLVFAAFTAHAWEDYFITLRTSRNLVEGHGLVFNPGERVHTFTSPLGVLIPALCKAITGDAREEVPLWLFRVFNATLLGAAAWMLWRRMVALQLGGLGRFTLFGLILADAKLLDFAINGMETAILVFFVLLLWSELEAATPRAPMIGAALAGLMWTRPDAFVLGGAILVAHIAFRTRRAGEPAVEWQPLVRGILLGGILYLPWFAWAWWYYGTPVPHTIIAKAAFTPPVGWMNLLLLPWHTLLGRSMLVDLFLPSYWAFGGWPTVLPHVAHALVGIAAFGWLVPGLPDPARRASFAVFLGMFYLCSIILFPWYVPPWATLAAIAVAFTVDALHVRVARFPSVAAATRISCFAVILIQLLSTVATAWQMRVQQAYVETPVRRAIGEWLRTAAAPQDTVFLEPLGYIGYFSRLKTYDFPGLSSPEVVAAIRQGARNYARVIEKLRPTWVVLRPHEAARPEFAATPVLQQYDLVKEWNAIPQLTEIELLPGRPWVETEARYLVFRRKPEPTEPRPVARH